MAVTYRSRNLVKLAKDKKCCGFNYSLLRGVLFIITLSLFFAYFSTQSSGVLVVFIIFAGLLALELISTVSNHFKEVNKIAPEEEGESHAKAAGYAVYIPAAYSMDTTTYCMDGSCCAMDGNVSCVNANACAA